MPPITLTSLSSSGTGKTTNFANLAYFIAKAGYKVKIIELDSRNSLKACCGLPEIAPQLSTARIFMPDFKGDYPFVPMWRNFAPAIEILQVDREAQEHTASKLEAEDLGLLSLKKIFKKYPIDCDLLILDAPGEHNILSKSAILASTHLFLGIEATAKCLEDVLYFVQKLYNYETDWELRIPKLSGFCIGKFNGDQAFQRDMLRQLLKQAQDLEINLFNPIRYSPYFINSYAAGVPVQVFAPNFLGSDDFLKTGNFFKTNKKIGQKFPSEFKSLPAIVPYVIELISN